MKVIDQEYTFVEPNKVRHTLQPTIKLFITTMSDGGEMIGVVAHGQSPEIPTYGFYLRSVNKSQREAAKYAIDDYYDTLERAAESRLKESLGIPWYKDLPTTTE